MAMGIVSAPEYLERRTSCRVSWLTWPNVGHDRALSVHFVVRALHAPPQVDALLTQEHRRYGDVLRVDVPWNETRLRGPVMSVAAWFRYAVKHLSAKLVAKLDDDAYVHTPGLEGVIREALHAAPAPERIYMGAMSWFHWYPRIFERSGFGWSYTMAWMLGRGCRNATTAEERCERRGCGSCVGPFPFASGFLAIMSTPLAVELFGEDNSYVVTDDLERLRKASSLLTRTGKEAEKVMEDIWLGSLVYRQKPKTPITYVALSERNEHTLVSDGWGLKVARTAILVHTKNHQRGKQLERFLAIDQFLRQSSCGLQPAVRCQSGCRAFLTKGELDMVAKSESFQSVWGSRVGNASFCTGAQGGAAFCRVGTADQRQKQAGERRAPCPRKPKDLLQASDIWPPLHMRAQALANETAQLQHLADTAVSLHAPARKANGRNAKGRAKPKG
jgi:hypothetical protein